MGSSSILQKFTKWQVATDCSVVTNTEKLYLNTFKYFIIQKYLKYYLNTQIPVKYLNTKLKVFKYLYIDDDSTNHDDLWQTVSILLLVSQVK